MASDRGCIEGLIDAVRARPIIYDLMNKNHKDQTKVNMAWQEVLDDLASTFNPEELARAKLTTVKDIKDKWHGLR